MLENRLLSIDGKVASSRITPPVRLNTTCSPGRSPSIDVPQMFHVDCMLVWAALALLSQLWVANEPPCTAGKLQADAAAAAGVKVFVYSSAESIKDLTNVSQQPRLLSPG